MLCSAVLSAQSAKELISTAKDFGLVAIPSDTAKLEQLIKEHSPDYDAFPTAKERVEFKKF
ncbi:hypothetical protein [uncultured Campylobacter sp.]|uniref:hypothetical protein n=1 Tax=uncultured Campylobacter sp. TaxID=218934 RepID=UPI00261595DA|nr:hypothetical protein [uncultured Campylobacter sp.]